MLTPFSAIQHSRVAAQGCWSKLGRRSQLWTTQQSSARHQMRVCPVLLPKTAGGPGLLQSSTCQEAARAGWLWLEGQGKSQGELYTHFVLTIWYCPAAAESGIDRALQQPQAWQGCFLRVVLANLQETAVLWGWGIQAELETSTSIAQPKEEMKVLTWNRAPGPDSSKGGGWIEVPADTVHRC